MGCISPIRAWSNKNGAGRRQDSRFMQMKTIWATLSSGSLGFCRSVAVGLIHYGDEIRCTVGP